MSFWEIKFIFIAALGAAKAVGGTETREGETRGSQEEGQTWSQRECFHGS